MNILGVTLARGGSKGVPGKHLRLLGQKPVLAWTVEVARAVLALDDYVVSSDSMEILLCAQRYGASRVVQRPKELAQDTTPTLPALQQVVGWWEDYTGKTADYIVELRATAPFKTVDDVEQVIGRLTRTGADSVIGVVELGDGHPARIKQIVDGRLRDWPGCPEPASGRRQDCQPAAYLRNGSIYAFRRDAVMGPNARIFGHDFSLPYVMPAERSVNIDTELDFALCQVLAERFAR